MVINKYLRSPMTQYTKFTKNPDYNENCRTLNNTNLSKKFNSPIMHNSPTNKPTSRGSNLNGLGINGSPSLSVNSTLPKPVLITNLNSSNIGSLIKNERIKSSALARSVTMRYNTNTKSQFENGNFANGLIQPASANQQQPNQTNHFHYNRNKNSPHQQQNSPVSSAQQQIINDAASQSKKEYLNLLSNIHRSSSIKVNRDKSNLSNYFTSLMHNKERGLTNSTANLSSSNNFYNQIPNSASNGHINQLNHGSAHMKQNFVRKQQPFSLRNNNINNLFHNSNNSINNNVNNENKTFLYNTNANNLVNSNSFHGKKTSISLDNVYNGLESLITNADNSSNNRYNINHKYDLNKSSHMNRTSITPTNGKKLTNSTSFNNINNPMLRNSTTPTTTNNNGNENEHGPNRQNKRYQNIENHDDEANEHPIAKDLSSSRMKLLNLNDTNGLDGHNQTNGDILEMEDSEQIGIKKIEITNKIDSRQSMNKKIKQRKGPDEAYNSKINNDFAKVSKTKLAPKTISQNSHHSNAQAQKLQNGTPEKNNNSDLQSRHHNTLNGRPLLRSQSIISHTTRDVNDSYAYTNVQQYIEENDLMPPEKAHTIKKWVKEVNSNFDDWEKKTIEKHIEDLFL